MEECKEYVLDGNSMTDQERMQDALQACFPVPPYYGRNLDALWDVLTEQPEARHIVIRDPQAMPPALFAPLAGLFLNLSREMPQNKLSLVSDAIRPGRYRHWKGREYRVLSLALHSETLEPMVVYQALYGSLGLWVRPAAMWAQSVEREGQTCPRFAYIGE